MRTVAKCIGLVAALLLAAPAPAQALGPSFTLGYSCKALFVPPTTRADGVTPITGALTYSVYLTMSPSQPATMPSTPTITGVAGTTALGDPLAGVDTWELLLCLNTNTPTGTIAVPTAGQWWITVQATEAGQAPGAQTSPPLPFVLLPVGSGVTGTPTSVGVR